MESAPAPGPHSTEPPELGWRAHWRALRASAAAPGPVPPGGRWVRARYGLAQPFLGLRIIMRSSDLLGISLAPAVGVLVVAGVVGYGTGAEHGIGRGLLAFLGAVAALAPLPSLLFGRVYAHMAAKARGHLGLSPQAPYLRGVTQVVGEWVAQLVILALGVLPWVALVRLVPGIGPVLALALQGLWALHWTVVEGYDNARTVPPGCTIAELEAEGRRISASPWFHRGYEAIEGVRVLSVVLHPMRMLSEVIVSLARPWRREVDLVQEYPWVSLGFSLGVAAMLAVPGLNLLLRPAVVVAGVHLRHRLGIDIKTEAGRDAVAHPEPASA
ncbi:MAG: hypothetical protein AAGF11_34230 [Myxococcota bacterium]